MSYLDFDIYGRPMFDERDAREIDDMTFPVSCAYCNRAYDLAKVQVTGRWTDCTAWNSPCCNRPVDDRGESGWTSRRDYYRITRNDQ